MSVLTKYQESRDLPLGHYDRIRAEKALEKEYALCHENAYRWLHMASRKGRKTYFSLKEAANLAGELCRKVGSPVIKKVYIRSNVVPEGAAACYSCGEIHFRGSCIPLGILIHELTHHISKSSSHGKYFVETQDILFQVYFGKI